MREPSDTAAPDVQPGEAGETGESELGSDRSNPGRQAVTVTWPFLGDHSAGKVHFANPPADTWTNVVGEVDDEVVDVRRIRHEYGDQSVEPPDPTGEELLEMDEEDESRLHKLRSELYEVADDALDTIDKGTRAAQDLLQRFPPVAHSEIRVPPTSDNPQDAPDVGDYATAVALTVLVAAEALRTGVRHLRRGREGV